MKESSKGRRVGRVTNRWTRDVAVRRRSHRRCPSNTEVKSDASHQPLEASGDAPRRVSLSATRHQLKWVLTYRSNVYAAFAIECLSYVSRDVVLIVPSFFNRAWCVPRTKNPPIQRILARIFHSTYNYKYYNSDETGSVSPNFFRFLYYTPTFFFSFSFPRPL